MTKFYNDYLGFQELSIDDTLIKVSDLVALIEDSEFKDQLFKLFDIESIKNDTLCIPGLKKIVDSIITRDLEYEKVDVDCHISDVSCVEMIDKNTVKLRFYFPDTDEYLEANTAYSSKRDYFESHYKLDRFANFCITQGHFDLLQENINYLNEKYQDSDSCTKKFRLLRDKCDDYFVRGITSVKAYNDYNIRFSLFVSVIAIHNAMKRNNYTFKITGCEYSESFIRLYFQKNSPTIIPEIGELNFVLEMSNDEIKREAFKFSGLFTIETFKKKTKVLLKPKNIKNKWISIQHNFLPSTVTEQLEMLSDFIANAEKEMKEDILELDKIENPDYLRFFLLRKIEKSNNPQLGTYKKAIKEKLDTKIGRISDLIILMGKIDEIVLDFDLKEYLRYLFYDVLRDKKKK
ncbi:hypothetical protein EV201_2851 [Ancylomarina subtilis]|uniref:Uncharacterized protein n=1 Tax=Ancylomarina subtilis TaxID=1639035 RepID=A0A4Q7V7L2_9BACT|nr:hypothetical protein [Ancylomarina subtilis]RZT92375.1 hypothetical protein EV201_2851 [Ancylomarina subtilis]